MANSGKRHYGFFWVTSFLFLFSLTGHWLFGWFAYVEEQRERQRPVLMSEYAVQATRDTLENWQSEFLQLIWQVGGLAFLWHTGSPQSKDGQERLEAKIDYLLEHTDGGEALRQSLDSQYPKA